MKEETYTGSCLCGTVHYRATGPATNPCFCHCESCRRASGGAYVPWATFPRAGFEVVQGELIEVSSSEEVLRGFCAACGTSLTYRHGRRPEDVDVALVTLDEPEAVEPEFHIWTMDKLPWVVIGDQLPQYEDWKRKK